MAKHEIRLWAEDIEEYDHPDIAIEFYKDDKLEKQTWVRLYPHRIKPLFGNLDQDERLLTILVMAFRKKVYELADL
ncbi:hypothetical protein BW686_09750 [Pseudomonas syringae]|uniref:Uncharacterized protein n=1 Tax=Pseudomonas syringae TaxID=317 RepID=A0A244ETA9_PSESX|nr:hypothetical protein [Pseudomonas syringae]MCI3943099.1 hypothetical protein [Pseudomonas syringae]OUM07724.1 hypothetical protein BW686_09750 [Pseudomonas syringae]